MATQQGDIKAEESRSERLSRLRSERKEIELEGYQHAMSNHQTIFRFEGMLNIIKEKYF